MADPLLAQSAVDRLKSAAWELVSGTTGTQTTVWRSGEISQGA